MPRIDHITHLLSALGLALASTGAVAMSATGSTGGPTEYGFEAGLDGWTVEDGDTTNATWVHVVDINETAGAVGLSGYVDNSEATITSPVIQVPEPSVLSFDATWWLEPGNYDWVDLEVRADDGEWTLLERFMGRGRWPMWDPIRYDLDVTGGVQVRFALHVDENCDGVAEPTFAEWSVGLRSFCGRGFWFDEVRVIHQDELGAEEHVPAWGDGPGATPLYEAGAPSEDVVGILTGGLANQAEHHRPGADDEASDQLANPDFLQRLEASGPTKAFDDWYLDPYLEDWEGTLGRSRDIWFPNRYRTPILGRMFAPLDDGPHALLVFVGGFGSTVSAQYSSMIYRLVQEGFVVLSVSPQGQRRGTHGSAVLPAPEFCDDGRAHPNRGRDVRGSWWRQPQEGGFVETQACAGFMPAATTGLGAEAYEDAYRNVFGHTFTFAVLDAVDWALSRDNPWSDLLDRTTPVGTFGHSAGGYGALAAAQIDDRIGAAVLLDSYGTLLDLPATTPTLAITSDNFDVYADVFENPRSVARDLADAGVDSGFLFLENTGHYGSAWWPLHDNGSALFTGIYRNPTRNPWAKPLGHHYLLNWFDLHLRGNNSAAAALAAPTFDGSADRTAQGQGRYVPGVGNVPYSIAGRNVADFLDPRVPSWIRLHGIDHTLS